MLLLEFKYKEVLVHLVLRFLLLEVQFLFLLNLLKNLKVVSFLLQWATITT